MTRKHLNTNGRLHEAISFTILLVVTVSLARGAGIEIYPENPAYWQYDGEPMMLLGGTDDEALFHWVGNMDLLRSQLDRLVDCGGNYVRCTMSVREGDNPVYPVREQPYARLDNGKYDLDRWNGEFWRCLRIFLEQCKQRDIVVQIELWATHDLVSLKSKWPTHPLNPSNNVNYGFHPETVFPREPRGNSNDAFYQTIPALKHDPTVLKYQRAFVDKILSYSLKFDNVLYCVDNEQRPQHPYEWGHYWAQYVRHRATRQGKIAYVSEMHRDFTTPKNKSLSRTKRMVGGKFASVFNYPLIYQFLELSETSTRFSDYDELWRNMEAIRAYTSEFPRPMANVKVYGGGDVSTFRERRPTIHRFCELICAGRSAVRFHRPVRGGENGMGLNPAAQACLRAVRRFCDLIEPWRCKPDLDLLSDREENEAYILANPGVAYGILMTGSYGDGMVRLDTRNHSGAYKLTWINLETGRLHKAESIAATNEFGIRMPTKGSKYGWLAALAKN
ncbi:MAG: DUF6298 domain-containing protein [Planctomycetota bacterium]|jgi:hypothetical protein